MKSFPFVIVVLLLLASAAVASPLRVENTTMFQEEGSDTFVYAGEIRLPEQGAWRLSRFADADDTVRFYLLSPREKKIFVAIENRKRDREKHLIETGQEVLRSYYQALKEYADMHGNVGPDSLEELDQKRHGSLLKKNASVW